ncbi:ABC transporter permease [Alteromonas sp. KUL49]|uniref:ABC transporter permease n=1 Tax=Alteromonas sp. KUL49 TaxID=2480798 RepID=UPI00102F1C03|nr:ABC transporter permease [Alteromonas sp. KUL49]TAP36850.1 ABC transporter permease [Alteromonas sp. KUL49]GEA13112.1 ABC transporter permease [Alteromonas sp. KUL49]
MSPFERFSHAVKQAMIILLVFPVLAGTFGVILPAAGFFPALGFNTVDTQAIHAFFATPELVSIIGLTLLTGVGATLFSLVISIALVAVVYCYRPFSSTKRLLAPLLVLPHGAVALALIFLLSPTPWIGEWFPYDNYGVSIIFALVIKEVPFLFFMSQSVLAQSALNKQLSGYYRTGLSLGYTPITAFLKLVLPSLYQRIRLPVFAVLAYAISCVEIPLVLGSNNIPTLSVAIVHWFNNVDLALRLPASVGAIVLMLLCIVALLLWRGSEQIIGHYYQRFVLNLNRAGGQLPLLILGTVSLIGFTILILALVSFTGVLSFATYWTSGSVLPQGITGLNWSVGLAAMQTPLLNSLILALCTSCVAVVVSLLALESEVKNEVTSKVVSRLMKRGGSSGYEKRFTLILFIPLLVPGVAFLFGLVWLQQLVFPERLWLSVGLSHLIYVLPYVFFSLAHSYRQIDPRYGQMAQSLGYSPFRVFIHVKLPLVFPSIAFAFAMGCAISLSQYLPTLLSSGGQIATVTTEAIALAAGSSKRLNAVYVIVQGLLPLVIFMAAWAIAQSFYARKTK